MSGSSTSRSVELSPTATAGLLLLFVVSGALGYLWSGLGGAFFVALGLTTTVAVVGLARKLKAQDRTRLVEAAPNLSGLPPGQALSVMGAMTGTDSSLSFKSELLAKLEEIDGSLEDDPETALRTLEPFLEKHPRSPAVQLRRARALIAHGDTDAAATAVSTTIGYALDGGMNPMAAAVFIEFPDLRNTLNLQDRHQRQLARALEQRGHTEEAASLDAS